MATLARGKKICRTRGAKVCPASSDTVSRASGAMVTPTSGKKVRRTRGAKVYPASVAAEDSTGSGVQFFPTSVAAKDTPMSEGYSILRRRKPCFLDENLFEIHRAARDDNQWRMELILLLGISDVDKRDKISRTALHVASAFGRPRMVRLLIQRGCDINLGDVENKSALIQALYHRNVACANALLDSGANPNIVDIDGNTALHHAVRGHNLAIVKRLLSRNVDIEARNKSGLTPLALANLVNNEKMVELLISRGANQDEIKSKEEPTPEEKVPPKPESCTPVVTEQQETRKQAWTETKSMTVVDISDEDTLSSQQKITSEYKEEKGPQKSESRIPVVDLQKNRKEAWTKTNSVTVIDVSKEDSLSRKQQLTSDYKEEKGPQKSESCTPVIDLQKIQKGPWTETNSMIEIDVSSEDSSSR
ncbi:POTE ankyrin domain family member B-like [Eptesicus fuscus]|uniref:POTE ankyrin domain family member B-like n=1 Tax=Eptesicus fuscus TaxID=29078 RepID=UPI002403E7B1|nr:POTE ankyrin domain family member B-like [Eptesicus fuscus]